VTASTGAHGKPAVLPLIHSETDDAKLAWEPGARIRELMLQQRPKKR
jgi:hypothetical protein